MFRTRLSAAVKSAFVPALRTALWVIKLMLPITLGISILEYAGVIDWLSQRSAPLFGWFGLPGESGLVFITSALSTVYSAVAVIATLGFDYRSVTILAVMSLICHNLIIESAIQRKTGASAWGMALLRIGTAFTAAFLLNLILPQDMEGRLFMPPTGPPPQTWAQVGTNWLGTMAPLTVKMVVIIISLNVVQAILREFRISDLLAVPLRPFMALFGLPRTTSLLWIICNVVGLTYGGAALVDEMKRGQVSHHDAELLNTHVAISHSLLEDTVVCSSVGVALPWLLLPRILLAIIAVWSRRMLEKYGRRRAGNAPARIG